MISILEGNTTPLDTKNTEDAVIPNNERKTIVHQQVNHNGICTKTAVCIHAWSAQTKSMTNIFYFVFWCLMTTTTQYPKKKKKLI